MKPRTKRMVFVCSGNLCRSPMAAALAKQMLERAGIPCVIISAGTLGINGSPPPPNAIAAMLETGIDISGHRSQGVAVDLIKLADHIVVMAPEHEEYLIQREPRLVPKIHRLWEYAPPGMDMGLIADPVGQDVDAFVRCRLALEACLGRWVERVKAVG